VASPGVIINIHTAKGDGQGQLSGADGGRERKVAQLTERDVRTEFTFYCSCCCSSMATLQPVVQLLLLRFDRYRLVEELLGGLQGADAFAPHGACAPRSPTM
jgi:Fe-S cluster biogenesis protein NfuA